jgi:signal transduction histidine kinase
VRRRLALLVAATTSLVLLAFLVPLAVLIDRAAANNAITSAASRSQSLVVPLVASGTDGEVAAAAEQLTDAGYQVTVVLPDGRRLGRSTGVAARLPANPQARETTVRGLPGGVLINQPVFREDGAAFVRTMVPDDQLNGGVGRAWTVLFLLALVLVGLSLVVADRLARSMTAPVTALALTAERLGRGDLAARVEPGGPDEIRDVGLALNRLATRITELLASEREAVADLSHRLRTPVTALRLDAEGLTDAEERGRLTGDVDELTRQVDALIREARRPVREGVDARCDAVQVVADRVAFWRVLADEQDRELTLELPPAPCPVRASESDLAAAVDALLGNVFAHTPDGTGFGVSVRPGSGGGAVIVVRDQGPGFADAGVLERGESRSGSTGLGLDIVRRTALASAGEAQVQRAPGGGGQVVVRLGPPA